MDMFTNRLAKILEWLLIIGGSFMVIMVCVEVVLRYFFGSSLFFTEELSRYVMIWIVFLGMALLMHESKHINIDALTCKLSPAEQNICNLFSLLCMLVFCSFLIAEGTRILPMQMEQDTVSMDVTMFWFYLSIPVGSALSIIFLIPRIIRAVSCMKNSAGGKEN